MSSPPMPVKIALLCLTPKYPSHISLCLFPGKFMLSIVSIWTNELSKWNERSKGGLAPSAQKFSYIQILSCTYPCFEECVAHTS